MIARTSATMLILGTVILLAACADTQPKTDVIRPVRTLTVAPKNGDVLTFAGEVRPRYETRLAFRVPGQIIERRVEIGSVVQAGDVIAVIDSKDLKLAASAASARLAQTESQAALAEADFKRYLELRAKHFISQAEFDRRETQVRQAREAVAAARAEHQQIVNQVSYGSLVAPHAGVITGLSAEVGQVVAAGQPVARIARQHEKEIAFSVPEHLLQTVEGAREIEARLWSKPGAAYKARLRELSPIADPASRTYPARLSIAGDPRDLALGMTAEVRVQTRLAESIRVPLTAIFHQHDRAAVWVVEGTPPAVKLVPIAPGAVYGDTVEIRSGLAPGQTIVTAGVNMLVPGQKVRVLDEPAFAKAVQ